VTDPDSATHRDRIGNRPRHPLRHWARDVLRLLPTRPTVVHRRAPQPLAATALATQATSTSARSGMQPRYALRGLEYLMAGHLSELESGGRRL